jgi:hypothetical protein
VTITRRRPGPIPPRRASITYWNRVEPSPRTNDLAKPLATEVADGLWALTRQWQLGEFRGEDCGSPGWLEVDTTSRRLVAWGANGEEQVLEPGVPLEKAIGDALSFDLVRSIEFGQTFETMLRDDGRAVHIATFRAAFLIGDATAAELGKGDADVLRLRRLAGGRALDGAALFAAAEASLPSLPVTVVASEQVPVRLLLERYVAIVHEYFGEVAGVESPAWDASRLAYAFDVTMGASDGFSVRPRGSGDTTWETFSAAEVTLGAGNPKAPLQQTITVLPSSVRFRGMAAPRCWDIEHAMADFAAIDVEPRDLGKLIFADLMLTPPREWYVIPLEQLFGTVMRLDNVLVRDVFGLLTVVHRAESSNWSMFQSSATLLPDSAVDSAMYGKGSELRFIRDEMLNIVWSVQQLAERPDEPPHGDPPPLPRYQLRKNPPPNWTAYMPMSRADGVMFERVDTSAIERIHEEELRRSGTRIVRAPVRSRGSDGSTHVWIARIRSHGPHESANGIRFDLLDVGEAG